MSSQTAIYYRERGSALVEFVLCMSLFWVPLFFGMAVLGFGLVRALEITQICRDAGHIYANTPAISQASLQTLLSSLATSMNLTNSGNSFIVLSTITYVDASDCQAANLSADSTNCPNMNNYVFMRQVIIGNSTLGLTGTPAFQSAFGTPASSIQDSSGSISPANYLTSSNALVTNFPATGITLVHGQVSYVSEMFATPLQPIVWSQLSNPVVSARSFF
ncbi:MAG: hypothetical protein JO150_01955 [Acidobacteriaceae bacterium]|nr:hypothetical protein [Acidobacteriaceae bacterium]